MTRKILREYGKWGLEVNIMKTEDMCSGRMQQDLQLAIGVSKKTGKSINIWE